MINMTHLSTEERREFLLGKFKSGKVASVDWDTEKSGRTLRKVKLWVEKALASGDKTIIQPPTNKNSSHINMVDLKKLEEGTSWPWVTVNLNTLHKVVCDGTTFLFREE